MINQMIKCLSLDRYPQCTHMREIRLALLARFMHLWKHHLFLGPPSSSPFFHSPLQRSQVSFSEFPFVFSAQMLEDGVGLHRPVRPQYFFNLRPHSFEHILPCSPRPLALACTW